MGIIFTNLTEKKNVPAFNFFLSVNEQFQESFLWDGGGGGGKTYIGNETKKLEKNNRIFSGEGSVLLQNLYRLHCMSLLQLQMLTISMRLQCNKKKKKGKIYNKRRHILHTSQHIFTFPDFL